MFIQLLSVSCGGQLGFNSFSEDPCNTTAKQPNWLAAMFQVAFTETVAYSFTIRGELCEIASVCVQNKDVTYFENALLVFVS